MLEEGAAPATPMRNEEDVAAPAAAGMLEEEAMPAAMEVPPLMEARLALDFAFLLFFTLNVSFLRIFKIQSCTGVFNYFSL